MRPLSTWHRNGFVSWGQAVSNLADGITSVIVCYLKTAYYNVKCLTRHALMVYTCILTKTFQVNGVNSPDIYLDLLIKMKVFNNNKKDEI